jgi:DNA-binding HxlR family transcriptional regulator
MDTKEARGVLWQKCSLNPAKKSEVHTCPMTQFVNLISGKWAIPILYR